MTLESKMKTEIPKGFKVLSQMSPCAVSTLKRPDMSRPVVVEEFRDKKARLTKQADLIRMQHGSNHPDYIRLCRELDRIREEEKNARSKKWRSLNPDKVQDYYERRRTSPNYKGKVFIRNLIMSGLRVRRTTHGVKIDEVRFQKYVGCSPQQFQKHIESQFRGGMNWLNRGVKWVHRFRLGWHEVDCEQEEGKLKMAHFSNIKVMEIVSHEEPV